ncbi:MAG: hypothetical protein Q9N67_04140 [Ghiorsea sp.]|nr:hypothetical protein [Ghiorsea sp.]
MNKPVKDKETERFYNISYFVIPIPMVLGLIFAVYVLLTEDERTDSFCTVAKTEHAYANMPLQESDFSYLEKVTLNICKDKDDAIDQSDGRLSGKVRWYVCRGTVCGAGWKNVLNEN